MLTTAASSTPNFMQPRSLTGAQFAELLTAAVKVINQPGGVLTAVQAGTALSDARIQVAAEASRWMYEKKTSRLASCMKVDKAQKIHQVWSAAAVVAVLAFVVCSSIPSILQVVCTDRSWSMLVLMACTFWWLPAGC